MRTKILTFILAAIIPTVNGNVVPATRTAEGIYCNYMCIITDDGNEWLLSDIQSNANPYMYESENGIFMPRFSPDQRVVVTFATNGTQQLEDDEIINVR